MRSSDTLDLIIDVVDQKKHHSLKCEYKLQVLSHFRNFNMCKCTC